MLQICYIYAYYVEVYSFYVYFLESFYHKWMLNFFKSFLCIYIDACIFFIFLFVNMVYDIDCLHILKNLSIFGVKAYLIMMHDVFNVLLDSVC